MLSFDGSMLVAHLQRLLLVVEGASRQAGNFQQARKRVQLPQLKHDLRSFFCACRLLA
jgi:hypothetical protein